MISKKSGRRKRKELTQNISMKEIEKEKYSY
jgi:hypothetical protein